MNRILLALVLVAWTAGLSNAMNSSQYFVDLLGDTLFQGWTVDKADVIEKSTAELLANKDVIGLYFSASWCGPCRQFTPQLASLYENFKKQKKSFDIVFVSRDNNVEEFVKYYDKMPWLALTWENVKSKGAGLMQKFKVNGVPYLVLLDGYDGSIITSDARAKIHDDPKGKDFPWRSRSVLNFVPRPVKRYLREKWSTAVTRLRSGLSKLSIRGVWDVLARQLVRLFRMTMSNEAKENL